MMPLDRTMKRLPYALFVTLLASAGADAQLLRSPDGRFESRPVMPAGTTPWVEVYELKLSARADGGTSFECWLPEVAPPAVDAEQVASEAAR